MTQSVVSGSTRYSTSSINLYWDLLNANFRAALVSWGNTPSTRLLFNLGFSRCFVARVPPALCFSKVGGGSNDCFRLTEDFRAV